MSEVTIGIDIGGTTTTFGFVDRDGNCLSRGTLLTAEHNGADAFVEALLRSVRKAWDELPPSVSVRGIGMGAPNANYFTGTVDDPPNLNWSGVVPLARLVGEGLGRPAVLTNDANAAALGEKIFGNAKDLDDFVSVTLGTGVGSGFVVGGRLVYGHDGFAGEIGHVIVEAGGRLCGCGRMGCLETYTSVTGLVRTVVEAIEAGKPSVLADEPREALNGKRIFDAAVGGDAVCREAFEVTGERLGLALANAVAITSPKAIVLFGGMLSAGPLLMEPTQRSFDANLLNIYQGKIELRSSGLSGPDAAILGASALAWNELDHEQHDSPAS